MPPRYALGKAPPSFRQRTDRAPSRPGSPPNAVAAATRRTPRDRFVGLVTTGLIWIVFLDMVVQWHWLTVGAQDPIIGKAFQANPVDRAIKLFMLFVGIIIAIKRLPLTKGVFRELNWPFQAFLVLAPVSVVWSISPGDTVNRCISIACSASAFLGFALVRWSDQRFQDVLRPVVTAVLVGSLAVGAFAPELMMERGIDTTLLNAWHGLANQKNTFGQIAAFGIILWLHGWLSREVKPWVAMVGLAVSLSCLLHSRSSTSLLASVFSVFLLLLLLRFPPHLRRYLPYIVGVFATLVMIYALAVLRLIPGLDVLFAPIHAITGKDANFSARSIIWGIIEDHIRLSPYIGSGYGAYWIGPTMSSPSFVFVGRMYFYPNEAHNGYLEMVNDLGYLGLICLLGYLIVYVKQCLRLMKMNRIQAALFLSLFFQQALTNLSESTWLQINTPFAFSIMTIATFSIARCIAQRTQPGGSTPAPVTARTRRAV
jgi:O-antigen ligase